MKKTLTVLEVAEYLGVHQDTIYTMVRKDEIPHFRVRRRILFDIESIDNWRNSHSLSTKPKSEVVVLSNSLTNNFEEDMREWVEFAYYLKKNGYPLGKIENLVRNIINTIKF